jgi:hypothetical protein
MGLAATYSLALVGSTSKESEQAAFEGCEICSAAVAAMGVQTDKTAGREEANSSDRQK